MSLTGNLLLICAFIISLAMINLYGTKLIQGDQAIGFLWSMIFLVLLYWVLMNLSTLIISSEGGLDWIGFEKGKRNFLTYGTLFLICFNILLSSFFRNEPNAPFPFNFYIKFVPFIIPSALTLIGFLLLNNRLVSIIPSVFFKSILMIIGLISIVGVGSIIIIFFKNNYSRNQTRISEIYKRQDENHFRLLQEIDTCDVTKNMVFILGLTGDNQDGEIREKALFKVKSNPDYEEELIRILNTGWVAEAFQFLASNDVDNPSKFAEPVRNGILKQASIIRAKMEKDGYQHEFYPDIYYWEMTRIIRTVDKFQSEDISFKSEMNTLKSVLESHSEEQKKRLKSIKLIEKWIKSND